MQEPKTSSAPRPIHLFHRGYKRLDPEDPDTLCIQAAED
jgi:hypothetical protein